MDKHNGHFSDKILSRTINRLRLAAGRYVSLDELTEAVWGDRVDGGPLSTKSYLRLIIHTLRGRGFPIMGRYSWGYRYAPEIFPETGGKLCNDGQNWYAGSGFHEATFPVWLISREAQPKQPSIEYVKPIQVTYVGHGLGTLNDQASGRETYTFAPSSIHCRVGDTAEILDGLLP